MSKSDKQKIVKFDGILRDADIESLAKSDKMIAPFHKGTNSEAGLLSFGCSSYGYDVRLGTKFKRSRGNAFPFIDPKKVPPNFFESFSAGIGDPVFVPPSGYLLGVSHERIKMPPNVTAICVGKSTYARAGLFINVTPLEAGWQGHITIEISNLESVPIRVYPMEGIMQIIFTASKKRPDRIYGDRGGKYQNQTNEPVDPL